MSYKAEALAESITKELISLTICGKLKWQLEGQKYSTTFRELSFEIEDTGQNWLIIHGEGGKSIATIMDTMVDHNVRDLLQEIKHSLGPRQRPHDDGSATLEVVLDTLKTGA